MSYKKYMLFRLIAIVIIAILGIWAGTTGNVPVLIPAVIILFFILLTLRRRVKEIVVDERVNTVGYRASRLAFVAFIILAVITGGILIYLAEDASDVLFHIGLTLNYAGCVLLVFYWLAYFYYNKKLGGKE
jgi:uncharacterized membrane protein